MLKPKTYLIIGSIIGAFLSALLVSGYFLLDLSSIFNRSENSSESQPISKPWIRLPASVSASDITKVTFTIQSHAGPLVGSDESFTTTNSVSFSSDETARKSSGRINYDTGRKKGSDGKNHKAVISKSQFERLAQTLIENDFSNETDSSEYITDTTISTLIVTYSGNTKQIRTSNTGKDSAAVTEILKAFRALENDVNWIEES
jgi:hypothetical protein